MKTTMCLPLVGLLLSGCITAATYDKVPTERPMRDIVGVCHINGFYQFTDKDYLNEGADQVLELGSRVVKLVIREGGWLPLGSCPVRFVGNTGWVEAGDSGKLALSSPGLLAGRKVAEIGGYPATFHVRDFLNCVKSRGQPRANADAACHSHIACHAANIAMFLNRKISYDPKQNVFLGDEEANRLRSEALREPWRS